MGLYSYNALVKEMIKKGIMIQGSRVIIMGITFKENVSDLRKSRVIDIIRKLQEFGIEVQITDPWADPGEVEDEYNIKLYSEEQLNPADAIVLAVAHKEYIERGWEGVKSMFKNRQGVVVDVKCVLDKSSCPENVTLWRL